MGGQSKIEWTHHTFNPWRGCTKVSTGCSNCYADTLSKRNPSVLGVWGRSGKRVIAAESYWREPLKWNAEAERAGERRRVFCASLADVFEGDDTMPRKCRKPVAEARMRLWDLIYRTPWLDWLLLTKRPENVMGIVGGTSGAGAAFMQECMPNVWLGTSVENQATADERIPHLLECPAAVRFLSCEPLLGPVDLTGSVVAEGRAGSPRIDSIDARGMWMPRIDWIIVGGESGPGARAMDPEWVRSIRDQCQAAGVPFFFKQWGEWCNWEIAGLSDTLQRHRFESHLFSEQPFKDAEAIVLHRVGKKAAGRLLDGREWNEFPRVESGVA